MRFPDFYAAKREDIPSYISAAAAQGTLNNQQAALERQAAQDRAQNLMSVGGGVMDVAQMDLGDGKTPLSEALRMGKAGVNKMRGMGGPAPAPAAPGPGGISPGPAPVSSALPKGQHGMQGGSPLANAVRNSPAAAPRPVSQPAPPVDVKNIDFLKGTGIDVQKAMPKPAPVVPANMGGKGDGFSIPTAGKAAAASTAANALASAVPEALRGNTAGAIKQGVGGAASTALMAGGPALAAGGPPGWLAASGLAALSLYGMLG